MDKRGISPLIATVLIIGFTIVIAAIVITFGTNLVKTTTESTAKQAAFGALCTGVEFNIKTMLQVDGSIKVTVQNENAKKLAGIVIVLRKSDNVVEVLSSQPVVDSTSDYVIEPGGEIGPFSTVEVQSIDAGYLGGEVEARAIVANEDGEMQACTSPTKAKMPPPLPA